MTEFPKEGSNLPEPLRATIHALTRDYPLNLIVDAAMLEIPQGEREQVALAFLPRDKRKPAEQGPRVKPPTEAILMDGESGEVLVTVEGGVMPRVFDYVDAEGVRIRYTRPMGGDSHYEFGADGRSVMRATYSKEIIG